MHQEETVRDCWVTYVSDVLGIGVEGCGVVIDIIVASDGVDVASAPAPRCSTGKQRGQCSGVHKVRKFTPAT